MKHLLTTIALCTCLIGLSNTAYAEKQKPSTPNQKEASAKASKKAARTARKARRANKSKDAKKPKANPKASPKPKPVATPKKKKASDKARIAQKTAARRKSLTEQKTRALAERSKAAGALRAAERKVDVVEREFKNFNADQKRQYETAQKQRARQVATQEKAALELMNKNIRELRQEVDRLKHTLTSERKKTAQVKK